MEKPSVELDGAERAVSRTIAVAISRFVTASAKPAARHARTAASIARSERGLRRLGAECGHSPGRGSGVWDHATCADRHSHSPSFLDVSHSASWHSACLADRSMTHGLRVAVLAAGLGGALLLILSIRAAGTAGVLDGGSPVGWGVVVVLSLGGIPFIPPARSPRTCPGRPRPPPPRG